MEPIIFSLMVVAVISFVCKEIILLYTIRQKVEGIVLQSVKLTLHIPSRPRLLLFMERFLQMLIAMTIAMYVVYMIYLIDNGHIMSELTLLELGVVILIIIVAPSRHITHYINEKGLRSEEIDLAWEEIFQVNVSEQSIVRGMKHITFYGLGKKLEGYLHERDLNDFERLVLQKSLILYD